MKAEERRKEILAIVGNSDNALPAAVLAEKLGVSRQVIVQDIAMLRANGFDIISTNRGYMLTAKKSFASRVFKCRHTFEQIVDEGYLIIGLGGRVEDIFVNHRVYGRIAARLESAPCARRATLSKYNYAQAARFCSKQRGTSLW